AEACGVIKKLSAEEAARMRSQARHKARMDYNSAIYGAREEGFKKGFKKGLKKVRLNFARNFLMEKMPVEFVAKNTELPLEEVKQLAASLTD
ncbi:MAG: hypothetical protein LBU79_05995, partial [Planctomycetota bacterium]|nr:hypothetical protein [Planctomycetota bacterium]